MSKILTLVYIFSIVNLVDAQILKHGEFTIGETLEFKSNILNENRTLNIYLPTSYDQDPNKNYQVIYLLDGSNNEDFIHVSGLVQFCSFSWINIIEESIVVGIANVDRKRDFTYPSTMQIDRKEFPTSGQSEKFIDFIDKELQALISKRYRTTENKTIIGQSLGGLLVAEILFNRPQLFDNYIIVSPSLWWDDENLLKKKIGKSLKDKSVYIGLGKEGPIMERLAQTLFYKLSLENKDEARLFFQFFDKQSHGDALHLAVYDAFEKLFKANRKKE